MGLKENIKEAFGHSSEAATPPNNHAQTAPHSQGYSHGTQQPASQGNGSSLQQQQLNHPQQQRPGDYQGQNHGEQPPKESKLHRFGELTKAQMRMNADPFCFDDGIYSSVFGPNGKNYK